MYGGGGGGTERRVPDQHPRGERNPATTGNSASREKRALEKAHAIDDDEKQRGMEDPLQSGKK